MKKNKKTNKFINMIVRVPRKEKAFSSLPLELRGPPQNRFGGHKCQRLRALKGSKFGAATAGCRVTNPDKLSVIIDDLRKRGLID